MSFLSFHTVHGVLRARLLKWFAIPFSSGPHFVRTRPSWVALHDMAHSFIELDKSVVNRKALYISINKTRSWLWLILWIFYGKIRLKLKKVGKTTRPCTYDLNQIPYDYTVEVPNRFKGLDLRECLKNYGCKLVTLYRRWWSRPSPRNRNAKRQNGCLRRPYK